MVMNSGEYVFTQIMRLVSSTSFQTIVNGHLGDYKIKRFSCWKQFLCMAFGQLTHRAIAKKRFMLKQSLYEIQQGLSISIFEKMPINQLFQQTQFQYFKEQNDNQLKMFDL